jgi:hypothetical protein
LLEVQNRKAEVIDSLGYRHMLRVAPNAAVERRRAALSSAQQAHDEMACLLRARDDV